MAPRIDPALPLVWRSTSELQLGALAPRVVIPDPGDLETGLLAALRHGASVATLHTIGAGLGGSAADVDRLLERLAPAFEGATDAPSPTLDARGSARVVVDGAGELTRLLLAHLVALGHDAIGLGEHDAESPAGRRGGSGTGRDGDVALAVIAAPWVIPPARHLRWLRNDVPHLAIVDDELGTRIGPLVEPGRGPCLRCLELHRRDADSAWPAIAAQLAGRAAPHPEFRTAFDAAAAAASAIDDRLRFGSDALTGASIRLAVGAPPSQVRHDPHPDCGCRAPAGTATARARLDVRRPVATSSVRAAAVPA